jgi:hypothetical protein
MMLDYLADADGPHPAITMTAVRQACALVQDVRYGSTELHVARVAAWMRSEPDLFAAVLVCLAAAADDVTLSPESLLVAMAGLDMDIRPALLEAHRMFEKYREAGRADVAQEWMRAGERVYQRLRRRRTRTAARLRAG